VANRLPRSEQVDVVFRVAGKLPEIWDPLTGEIRAAAAYRVDGQSAPLASDASEAGRVQAGRTTVPLEFAPCGSLFVVFRKPAATGVAPAAKRNFSRWTPQHELSGPWTVRFDPKWGGPASAMFPELISWTERPEPGIKFYSGTATYEKSFDLPESLGPGGRRLALDLGQVKMLAEVRLNGKNLGILWAPPFRVDVTDAIKPRGNRLEIDVVNFWPNRVIGDQSLPEEKRLTRTNIRRLTKDTPLLESGLLGPVTIQAEE
jgi:hypothetical protein